jgi:hypothetical protein
MQSKFQAKDRGSWKQEPNYDGKGNLLHFAFLLNASGQLTVTQQDKWGMSHARAKRSRIYKNREVQRISKKGNRRHIDQLAEV